MADRAQPLQPALTAHRRPGGVIELKAAPAAAPPPAAAARTSVPQLTITVAPREASDGHRHRRGAPKQVALGDTGLVVENLVYYGRARVDGRKLIDASDGQPNPA